jgi:hypothetical protein
MINPCKLNTYKGFLFGVHKKVRSFGGSLKSSLLTYPFYKIGEERGRWRFYLSLKAIPNLNIAATKAR